MDTIVIVSVSILGILFLASFVALLVLCRRKYRSKSTATESDSEEYRIISPSVISTNEEGETLNGELELTDIITCDDNTLRELLETEDWAFDVQGLIPHCIRILRLCREVTNELVANTMTTEVIHPSQLDEIVQVARRITPRVDDLMRALQPPLNPSLLEARAAALVFSVSHLALIIKSACTCKASVEWVDQAMVKLDQHMRILRGVAMDPVPTSVVQQSDATGASSSENADVTRL